MSGIALRLSLDGNADRQREREACPLGNTDSLHSTESLQESCDFNLKQICLWGGIKCFTALYFKASQSGERVLLSALC